MIATECKKSKVVMSSLFARHYPDLYRKLSEIIRPHQKKIFTVSHTKDYWVRDFMPIQIGENVFVKYVYNPNYLQDKTKYLTDVDEVLHACPLTNTCEIRNLPLILDGGNIVLCQGKCQSAETLYIVMTDKVFTENPTLNKHEIEQRIKKVFQEPHLTIVWLPWDKQDTYGHTDGIVRYVGMNGYGKPIVMTNLELYDEDIANRMYSILCRHFEVIELQLSEYDKLSWAYINCLQTKDFIIIPGIGNSTTDAQAMAQYKRLFPLYKDNIHQIQMRDFIAANEGALNCLTWTIRE